MGSYGHSFLKPTKLFGFGQGSQLAKLPPASRPSAPSFRPFANKLVLKLTDKVKKRAQKNAKKRKMVIKSITKSGRHQV